MKILGCSFTTIHSVACHDTYVLTIYLEKTMKKRRSKEHTHKKGDIFLHNQHSNKVEHEKPIVPHANGEPLLNGAPHLHILFQSATILLVVWSTNGNGSAITSKD